MVLDFEILLWEIPTDKNIGLNLGKILDLITVGIMFDGNFLNFLLLAQRFAHIIQGKCPKEECFQQSYDQQHGHCDNADEVETNIVGDFLWVDTVQDRVVEQKAV